jgi:hypothetical protein
MKEAPGSSETSVLTRAPRRNNPEDTILHDHYLMVAKVRKTLAVNKQRFQRFHADSFNFNKLNEVGGEEQYRLEVSNTFAASKDLDTEADTNTVWETV